MIMLASNQHHQPSVQYTSAPPSTIIQQPPQPIYSVIPNTASHNFSTDHHQQQHLGMIPQQQGMIMRDVLPQPPVQNPPLYSLPSSNINLNYSTSNQPSTSHNAPFASGQSTAAINKRIRRQDTDNIPKNHVFRKLKPIVRAATPSPIVATHQTTHEIISNNAVMYNQQPTYSEQFINGNIMAVQTESIPMNHPLPSNVQNTPQSIEGAFVNHHSLQPVPSHIMHHQEQDPYHHQQFHSLQPVHHQPVVNANSSPHNILQQPPMELNQNPSSNQALDIRQQFHAVFENQPLPKALLRKLPSHVIDEMVKKDPKIAQQLRELQEESILPQIHTPFRKTQELDLKDPNAGNNISSPVTIDDEDTFMSNQGVIEESVNPSILKLDEASFELIKSKRSDAHSTTNTNGDVVYIVEDDDEDEEHEEIEHKTEEKHEHPEQLKQPEEEESESSDHLISDHGVPQKITSEIVQPHSPVQIQSTLESEQHLSKIDLYSWSFVFKHVPNDKLYVHLMGKTSSESDIIYKSSFIVHRINSKTVLSSTGTKYVLASEMNHERNSENLNVVGKEFLEKFCNSSDGPFPKEWDDLLKKEFLRLETPLTSSTSKNHTSMIQGDYSLEKVSASNQRHFSPQTDEFMDVGEGFANTDPFQPSQHEDDEETHHADEPSATPKRQATTPATKKHKYISYDDEQSEEEDIPSDTPKKKTRTRKNNTPKKPPTKKKKKKLDRSTDEDTDEEDYVPEEEEDEKPKRKKKKNETPLSTKKSTSKRLSQTSITAYSKSKKSKYDTDEEEIPSLDVETEGKLMSWRKQPTSHTPPTKKTLNPHQDIPIVHKYYYTPPAGLSKESEEESPQPENTSDQYVEPTPPKPRKMATNKRKSSKFSTKSNASLSNDQEGRGAKTEERNIFSSKELVVVIPRKPKNLQRRKKRSELDLLAKMAGRSHINYLTETNKE
ncbi:hypothetical protein C9374_003870 [Naegleria lovaniensis]|uniref:SANTA domain-containing protein n=1 Tax=Naegleria lovaniensis TaxID=51637 RepID=A0AA88H8H9_NAELO|nr:uncharacterized protein C9374_003870 [Naegleria lovaniensis]KAG2394106.1 hypothetical protein C9374_003870 [Naegleria lovaniensis]